MIIFDLDGVIVDSEPVHQALEKRLFKELNIEVPPVEHQKLVGMNEENLWGTIIHQYKLNVDLQSVIEKKRTYMKSYLADPKAFKPIHGVIPLIKQLKQANIKLVLASSSPLFYIKAILKKFAIDDAFEATVSGEEVTNAKPAPDIFIEAARRVGKKPQSCLVIEDSTNGVRAARAAGMIVLAYNDHRGGQDLSQADFTIDNFCNFDIKKYCYNS